MRTPLASTERARSTAVLAAMAVGGLACLVAPVLLLGAPLMDAPLFPLLRTGIEKLGWPALLLLLALGIAGGLLSPVRARWLGLASVALLPLAAFAEMAKDPTSHNLIPFELGMYAFLSIAAGFGARGARWVRARAAGRPRPSR